MLGMQEALIFLVIFTFWVIRIYYKLYDKTTKFYVFIIGILIVFWMVIRITKGLVYSDGMARFCWYLYYVPLIFAPSYFYMCVYSLTNNLSRKRKIFIYSISSVLLFLVISNDFHQWVFRFPEGLSNYNIYKHFIGYYVICIYIFYFFGKGMVLLAINQFKLKKSFRAFFPLFLLILGLLYTIFYVIDIPFFRGSNLSVILSVLICLGIELIFYLGLIPNNSKYKKAFINSSLDMLIVSLEGDSVYTTKTFNKAPKYIVTDIKNNSVKDIYRENGVIYNVVFNKDSYVVMKRDIEEFNRLKKEIKKRRKRLLEINSKLKVENEVKRELEEIKLRNEIVLKLENSMYEKKSEALSILNNDCVSREDLEYVKILISYCKRKSSLIISELNCDIYGSLEIKMLIEELFTDFNIVGEVVVDSISVSSYDMSIIYDIVFEVLKKCKCVMLFVSLEDSKIKLRFILDEDIDIIMANNIGFKKCIYGEDTELIYSFKRSDAL